MSTREGVGRRVAVDRHRGLDLAEAVGDRGGRVGGEQQRVVQPVGDVRLVAGRAAHAQLADGHLQLDRAQEGDHAGELLGRGARGEADDLRARDVGVDDQAGERDVAHGVRLLRDHRVEAARGDERVDEVIGGRGRPVELGDAAVRVERDGGLGVVRRGERDEPRLVVALREAVQIDRPLVERLEAAQPARLVAFVHTSDTTDAARMRQSPAGPVQRHPPAARGPVERHPPAVPWAGPVSPARRPRGPPPWSPPGTLFAVESIVDTGRPGPARIRGCGRAPVDTL